MEQSHDVTNASRSLWYWSYARTHTQYKNGFVIAGILWLYSVWAVFAIYFLVYTPRVTIRLFLTMNYKLPPDTTILSYLFSILGHMFRPYCDILQALICTGYASKIYFSIICKIFDAIPTLWQIMYTNAWRRSKYGLKMWPTTLNKYNKIMSDVNL